MASPLKILMLDDDEDFLTTYQEMLSKHLPSQPEVKTAATATRALAILETEPFTLLTVDLNLPRMDGLQVLSIARRKYPRMRVVVLTGVRDEQFRTRAYAMGVDQYWLKPESDQETGLFMESVESLLTRDGLGGFRGIQSKGLVDIIQLECLSQSSTLLRITNGVLEGRIWIQNGDIIDAEAGELSGEAAFQRILAWKTGSFENLPADPGRPRSIFTSYQGLLLNTAQAIDEAAQGVLPEEAGSAPMLAELSQFKGIEFAMSIGGKERQLRDCWGLEDPKPFADWMLSTLENFASLGDRLQVGELQQVFAGGYQRKIALTHCGLSKLGIGFPADFPADEMRSTLKLVVTKWAS